MHIPTWSRRRFVTTSTAGASALLVSRVWGSAAQSPLFDSGGAAYVFISRGSLAMGEREEIPIEMCEPLAYMTRDELQAMFPNGDPEKFVLSDVLFQKGDPDEKPVREVAIEEPFYLAATQVTNLQYERFDPSHKALRGKFGFSKDDDEAVVYVSWHDANAYCEWLAGTEGKPYRLPTEVEWEYAARAGTSTLFSTGDSLPASYLKDAKVTDFTAATDKVSLLVGQRASNSWDLFDMHGNVEEWVSDWYAPYTEGASLGPDTGLFKITRGGSFGTFAYYLRSANRSAALPETRGFTIGFRVACGEHPRGSKSVSAPAPQPHDVAASRTAAQIYSAPASGTPYFRGPRQFVRISPDAQGPLYSWHNHDTSIAECPNGDLLAIWYTCAREQGRELSVAASRLRLGADEWDEAYSFYDTPDRNDHTPALWFDGESTLFHLNGTALSHYWEPLQIILRTSQDNGVTWSKPRYIAPDFGLRTMVCQPIIRLSNGWLIFGADAHPQCSTMWLSKDEGESWEDTGGNINGIHAAIVELKDGRLMALGRGNNVHGQMPMSISTNFGKTWNAQASELPPVTYTQRFSMKRLREGALALATFLPDVSELGAQQPSDRELAKLCVCVSYDDGKTWPVRRILSDDNGDHGVIGMSNGRVYMGPGNGEPTGYVSLTQSRNGLIHVISSMNHYEFNLEWVESAPNNPSPMPSPKELRVREELPQRITSDEVHKHEVGMGKWSNERDGSFSTLDISKGFSVEADIEIRNLEQDYLILRAFARSGCTMCNRYWLRVNGHGVAYWYAGAWQPISKVAVKGHCVYRLCVRDDTCVQIYANGSLLSTYPPSYEIGFAQPTRGNWIEWECWPHGETMKMHHVAYDLDGPFRPR